MPRSEVSATREVAQSFATVLARWASLHLEVGDGVNPPIRTAVPATCPGRRWPRTGQWARQWLSQGVGDEEVLLVYFLKEVRLVKVPEAVYLLTMSPSPMALVSAVGLGPEPEVFPGRDPFSALPGTGQCLRGSAFRVRA